MLDGTDYYQRRFAEELAAAERATCPQAAQAHRDLANLYLLKIEAAAPVPAARFSA
jgi:hypothetical protein